MSGKWPRVRLGEVLRRSNETVAIQPDIEYREITVRLWGNGVIERGRVLGAEIAGGRRFVARIDQFIASRIDARNGAMGIVPAALDGAVVTNDFPLFDVASDRLLPAFLGWLSKTAAFVELCLLASEGTTNRVRLKEERFLALEMPLPPLAEQRRVVSRINAAARSIHDARQLRGDVEARSAALGDSLANAVFSKLGAASPKRPLGECAEIQSGVTLGRQLKGTAVRLPYLRVANVQAGRLDLSIVKEIEVYEHEAAKWLLRDGDILLTEGGDWDKLGRGTVWRGEIANCIHQNHIFRLRVDPAQFDPDFLAECIGSPMGKAYFQAASKQTTNLASINQRQLRAFPVPVLALGSQQEIVKELGAVRSLVAEATPRSAEVREQLDALLPAILDRAFAGAL